MKRVTYFKEQERCEKVECCCMIKKRYMDYQISKAHMEKITSFVRVTLFVKKNHIIFSGSYKKDT